ncbi:DMT family transporter [Bosea sp. (in: a-proteobacteria)]|uniref:DMT family transporter n=1 Tax=Bosea sp. (in: a-proteobacteria) TaxID=1871050 RepID=UPI0025C1D4EF|nr:DMT family transporter [Bosea sp. (in: a-proteobacteria)]
MSVTGSAPMPAGQTVGKVLLMATALGWGLNWSVLKFVLQDWPPLFARGTAGLLGALCLALLAMARGDSLAVPKEARAPLLAAASINVFAWMGFTALALNWLKVSEGALIAYSMPIWAMMLAWPLLGARPTRRSLVALGLSITGMLLLMGGPEFTATKLPGVLFAFAAAVLFALGTVKARKPLAMPGPAVAAWQVALGCLPMVALGLILERPNVLSLSAKGALGLTYMAVGPMALCYLTWFGALRRLPTAVAATSMLIVPVVGTLTAMPLLGETLGLREAAAITLTISGVALALRS